MMGDIIHLHSVLLILMDELDRVCKENDINYTLTGGSMLGAVRHNGFIPWDDDMDVAMTRENYDKLIMAKDEFGKEFFLQTNQTDKNYGYGYAKLLLQSTETIEFGHENTKYKKGIFIDIFPMDNIPAFGFQQKVQANINYFLQKCLRKKMRIKDNPNWGIKKRMIYRIIYFLCIGINMKYLLKLLNKNMIKYDNTSGTHITNLCGMYGYEKESVPKKWFEEYERIDFEGKKYSVIKCKEQYLEKIYGNYMKIPPIGKRHTHQFLSLKFGEY